MSPKRDAANSIVLRTGVPDGWCEKRVADLALIVGGGTPDREQSAYWQDGRIPWITPTDLTANGKKFIASGAENITELGLENSNATLVDPGAIVFSTRGTVGSMGIAAVPLTCNQSCEILVPRKEKVAGGFLYHLLNFGLSAFIRLSAGTTFSAITRGDIERVRFAVPANTDEQCDIARSLDAIDVAIERCRTELEQALALRKSLLAALLTFGIGPDGLLRNPQLRPSDFVATAIGTLPVSWTPSAVGAEFSLQNGFTLNEERRPRFRKRRYLRVANVQRDVLDLHDVQELEANDIEVAPRVLAKDDLLVVEGHADRMQIGRCALVTPEAEGMTFQNHLFRLRSLGRIVPAFGCLWLNSSYSQRYWNARCATSSGLNTINQRTLRRLVFPVPQKEEQEKIVNLVAAQRKHLDGLMERCRCMEMLKKSLMHDLLTGRVRLMPEAKAASL
jgi:type I restriction enzyme S subunit